MSDDYRYKLIYKVEKPEKPLTKHEVPEGYAATDALLLVSILSPPDGSQSTLFIPVDGRNEGKLSDPGGVMTDDEMFKVWSLLSKRLSESPTLTEGKRDFCRMVFETIRQAILANRG